MVGAASIRAVRGFTLFELLVVFAIAGLLLALVPVSYQRLREVIDYRDTVRTMAADLSAARLAAASTGRGVAFTVDLDLRRYGVEGRNARAIPDGIDVRIVAAETEFVNRVARIRFFPTGHATGGSIDIMRQSGAGTRLRADWLDGRISMQVLPQ